LAEKVSETNEAYVDQVKISPVSFLDSKKDNSDIQISPGNNPDPKIQIRFFDFPMLIRWFMFLPPCTQWVK